MAHWLLLVADRMKAPWNGAIALTLAEGALPQAPELADNAAMLQLHAWLDMALQLSTMEDQERQLGYSVLALRMLDLDGFEAVNLVGQHQSIDLGLWLEEGQISQLENVGDAVDRRRMNWTVIDPVIDGWVKRCVEASSLPDSQTDLLLTTWSVGRGNGRHARFPSMDTLVEPVAHPWVRAAALLVPNDESVADAHKLAWVAARTAVNGGLHGDDDSRWMGRVAWLTQWLDASFDARAELNKLLALLG